MNLRVMSEVEDNTWFQRTVLAYYDAYDTFTDILYPWVIPYQEQYTVTQAQFKDMKGALAVGQKALRLSQLLSAEGEPGVIWQKATLVRRVNELLQMKRSFEREPSKQVVYGPGLQDHDPF